MAAPIKVLVLGGRGMLGSMLAGVLRRNGNLGVSISVTEIAGDQGAGGGLIAYEFDATRDDPGELLARDDFAWIVNAIGVTKARIDEAVPAQVARAIEVNAAFPFRLAAAAADCGQRVIQIATDGVFTGSSGPYDEGRAHDAGDVYGKSKSLGEVPASNVLHLRCSIVGDPRASTSLLGWALGHPRGASIAGYSNHRWNGVTTAHFAGICEAVIAGGLDDLPSPLHLVPADAVSKAELLELAVRAFDRTDLTVTPEAAETAVDRTLRTSHPEQNERLWAAARHPRPPTIAEMIETLAAELKASDASPQGSR